MLGTGRIGGYTSDVTGVVVDRIITNYTAGKFCTTKRVNLPANHKLKQLGIDYFEYTTHPRRENKLPHIAAVKAVKTEGEEGEAQKFLAEGFGKEGIKNVRDFIKMIEKKNIHVS